MPETAILCRRLPCLSEESAYNCNPVLSARMLLLPGWSGLHGTGSLLRSGTVAGFPVEAHHSSDLLGRSYYASCPPGAGTASETRNAGS